MLLLTMLGCGINKTITLRHIVYDNEKKNYIVYLKESNEYVPYLVLDSNYNGNVLVLRQNVLPEMMQYKEHDIERTIKERIAMAEKEICVDLLGNSCKNTSSSTSKSIKALIAQVILR